MLERNEVYPIDKIFSLHISKHVMIMIAFPDSCELLYFTIAFSLEIVMLKLVEG